jgi:hypothetical protein
MALGTGLLCNPFRVDHISVTDLPG